MILAITTNIELTNPTPDPYATKSDIPSLTKGIWYIEPLLCIFPYKNHIFIHPLASVISAVSVLCVAPRAV